MKHFDLLCFFTNSIATASFLYLDWPTETGSAEGRDCCIITSCSDDDDTVEELAESRKGDEEGAVISCCCC